MSTGTARAGRSDASGASAVGVGSDQEPVALGDGYGEVEDEPRFNLLICECSDPACAESLEITPQEYEAVRADRARFVVLKGHEMPEVERVVEDTGRYIVVEKLGAAAEMAQAGDPRRA
jgi:hypothetical protein